MSRASTKKWLAARLAGIWTFYYLLGFSATSCFSTYSFVRNSPPHTNKFLGEDRDRFLPLFGCVCVCVCVFFVIRWHITSSSLRNNFLELRNTWRWRNYFEDDFDKGEGYIRQSKSSSQNIFFLLSLVVGLHTIISPSICSSMASTVVPQPIALATSRPMQRGKKLLVSRGHTKGRNTSTRIYKMFNKLSSS